MSEIAIAALNELRAHPGWKILENWLIELGKSKEHQVLGKLRDYIGASTQADLPMTDIQSHIIMNQSYQLGFADGIRVAISAPDAIIQELAEPAPEISKKRR